jgi:glycosylphosphatidylinositol transamidase (GPIT) subunit GPI8
MFSDCSGPCIACACHGGGCLAGHGDDDFVAASDEELNKRLEELSKLLTKAADEKGINSIEFLTVRRQAKELMEFFETPQKP